MVRHTYTIPWCFPTTQRCSFRMLKSKAERQGINYWPVGAKNVASQQELICIREGGPNRCPFKKDWGPWGKLHRIASIVGTLE